jgi:hypothetical protein
MHSLWVTVIWLQTQCEQSVPGAHSSSSADSSCAASLSCEQHSSVCSVWVSTVKAKAILHNVLAEKTDTARTRTKQPIYLLKADIARENNSCCVICSARRMAKRCPKKKWDKLSPIPSMYTITMLNIASLGERNVHHCEQVKLRHLFKAFSRYSAGEKYCYLTIAVTGKALTLTQHYENGAKIRGF